MGQLAIPAMRFDLALACLLALASALVLSLPGLAAAQTQTENQNGSGAQTGAQAAPIDPSTDSEGAAAAEPEPGVEAQTSLPDLEDEVNCVVCGVTLDRATEAPQALQERELIRELIAQGLTKDEIKEQLVLEYGEDVLATPSTSGFDLFAWLVPGAAVVIAAIAIALGLRRWRRRGPSDEDPPPPPLEEADRLRLDRDLERYGV